MFKVMIQPKNTVTQRLITFFCLDHTFPLKKPIWGGGGCGLWRGWGRGSWGKWLLFSLPNFLVRYSFGRAEGENQICPLLLRKQLWGQFVKLAVIASTWSLLDWRKTRALIRAKSYASSSGRLKGHFKQEMKILSVLHYHRNSSGTDWVGFMAYSIASS